MSNKKWLGDYSTFRNTRKDYVCETEKKILLLFTIILLVQKHYVLSHIAPISQLPLSGLSGPAGLWGNFIELQPYRMRWHPIIKPASQHVASPTG